MKKLISTFVCSAAIATLGVFSIAAPQAEAAPKCPNGPEYNYISRDAEECLTITFFCEPGTEPFFNECGCGCVDTSN